MAKRRNRCPIVFLRKYYAPEELMSVYGNSLDEIMKIACLSNAMCQIGKLRLINRKVCEETLKKIMALGEYHIGNFMLVEDAVVVLGLPEMLVLQLASDGDSLIVMEKTRIICIEKLCEYIMRFRKKVVLISVDDVMEHSLNDKRRAKDLCLR